MIGPARKSHHNYFLSCGSFRKPSALTFMYFIVIINMSDSSTSMDHRRSHAVSRLKTIMANRKKESRGVFTTNRKLDDMILLMIFNCLLLYIIMPVSLYKRLRFIYFLTTPIDQEISQFLRCVLVNPSPSSCVFRFHWETLVFL